MLRSYSHSGTKPKQTNLKCFFLRLVEIIRRVLAIYIEKPNIPVRKSNGLHLSPFGKFQKL